MQRSNEDTSKVLRARHTLSNI